jgi:hypothetical protein
MSTINEDVNILSMFGLTAVQTRILFSIENLLVQKDIQDSQKNKEEKQKWLAEWSKSILDYLVKANIQCSFLTRPEILKSIALEHSKDINNTWYYLIMLEATLFEPYSPIADNKEDNKLYKKLKYKEQSDTIKSLVRNSKIMDEIYIDRFQKTYSMSISKLTGKVTKIALYAVGAIAIAAIAAATAGVLAGPIAVALFGTQFAGLSGAALTAACLAMAGGGAIAVGGAGMAGGVLAIVGGGALLGMAGGGAVGGAALFVASAPELALTQAAKLEVVLKEIILNAQQDIKCAQHVLEIYKNQIACLHSDLAKSKLEHAEDKKTINNMKKSIEYMEKAYKNISTFASCYEIGSGLKD